MVALRSHNKREPLYKNFRPTPSCLNKKTYSGPNSSKLTRVVSTFQYRAFDNTSNRRPITLLTLLSKITVAKQTNKKSHQLISKFRDNELFLRYLSHCLDTIVR